MIEGPRGVLICYKCILLNKHIVEEEARRRGVSLGDQWEPAG